MSIQTTTQMRTMMRHSSLITRMLLEMKHIALTVLIPDISNDEIKQLFYFSIQLQDLSSIKYIIENTSNVFELNDFEQALAYAEKFNNLQLYMYIFYIIRAIDKYAHLEKTRHLENSEKMPRKKIPIEKIANITCQDFFYLLCVKK